MDNVLKVFKDEDFGLDTVVKKYKSRAVIKGIIVDSSGAIAVFNRRVQNEYKLPGGVIEDLKDIENSFVNEIKREIGCNVEIIENVGIVKELIGQDEIEQDTYIFVGRVLEKGKIDYQAQEVDEFGKVLWVSPEEALKLLNDYKKEVDKGEIENTYHTKFAVYKDEFIVRYYLINYIY